MTLFLGEGLKANQLSGFAEQVSQLSREMGIEVWTTRVALPPCSAQEFPREAEALDKCNGFDFAAVPLEAESLEEVQAPRGRAWEV